jgi:hypothetical protein
MNLNTKKLFASTKKPKYTSNKKVNFLSSGLTAKEKANQTSSNKNSNSNQNHSKKTNLQSQITNPFNKNLSQRTHHRISFHKKIKSSKNQNVHLEFLKFKENNNFDLNNILLTSESESNQNNKYDIEELCKLFKDSKLKSTIIMDNNGNNKLNSEQEKFIKDYLDKKDKLQNNINQCSINSIKVQNYNHNNILLKKKSGTENKALNLKYRNFDLDKFRNDLLNMDKNGIINNNKPFLSTKNNNRFKDLLIYDEKNEENEEINTDSIDEDKENNSMFENCTNKSFDSSFLGSSIAEDFYQTFTCTIDKN